MNLLEGLRIATTALNLPGPVACARLRDLGAAVVKVEPPAGDPFEAYCPAWYGRLHERMEVRRIDLKSAEGREAMDTLLAGSDLLVTAQRPSALARMGLGGDALSRRFPRLCRVNITGHAPPHEETPGHDLTYMAAHGLVTPGVMPPTLFADMAGAERAVSTALALVIGRARGGAAAGAAVPLEEAAAALAQPLREGLTRRSALLGGGLAGYNLYATSDGWIALAALEPHFAESLSSALGIDSLTVPRLAERFSAHTAAHWERWARERGLPLVALRDPSNPSGH